MNVLDPLGDGISCLELVRAGGSDLDVVNAARVSYGKRVTQLDEKDVKLINYLLKNKHTSPFEHTQLVYRVKAPIFVIRQWMRHRIGVSYNELSGRYAVLPLDFYMPVQWRTQDPVNKQSSVPASLADENIINEKYQSTLETCKKTYQELLDRGVCRELARGVLPVTLYTELIFTCNLISLFHFATLRADSHAQWEIQQYAKGMIELGRTHFPLSIKGWEGLQKPAETPLKTTSQNQQVASTHH